MHDRAAAAGWPALLDDYVSFLLVEKGLSPNTLQAYRRDLAKFADFISQQGCAPDQVTQAQVLGFLRSMRDGGLSARSSARALVSVRSLFRFLALRGRVQRDPTINVEAPK